MITIETSSDNALQIARARTSLRTAHGSTVIDDEIAITISEQDGTAEAIELSAFLSKDQAICLAAKLLETVTKLESHKP